MASQISSYSIVQQLFRLTTKKASKAPHNWPFTRGVHGWRIFSSQRANNAESFSMSDVIMMTLHLLSLILWYHLVGFVQERRNSSAMMTLHLLSLILWYHLVGFVQERRNSSAMMTLHLLSLILWYHLDGFVQERRNSIANAMELCLSCTNPLISPAGFPIMSNFLNRTKRPMVFSCAWPKYQELDKIKVNPVSMMQPGELTCNARQQNNVLWLLSEKGSLYYMLIIESRVWNWYRKISNIRRTKSPTLNDSHLVLKSSLPYPMKPGAKSRMKM